MSKPSVSFEFFPPRTDHGRAQLIETAKELALLKPAFMTVTYGAGGSTKGWTMEAAQRIQQETGIPTAAHLTCVNTFKDGIHGMAHELWANGIRHIVALRGDIPPVDAPLNYADRNYYHFANELVAGLKTLHDFEISVAAYPEKHPDAPDMATDISNLKRKCDAGATRAITQFFFENETYFRFLDRAQAAGITTPIIPGVLPIANFEKMLGFAKTCGADVPGWLRTIFEETEDPYRAAQEALIMQVRGLAARGVPHIHFYTLNNADLVTAVCKAL
ncbi:MAG: methylenetetrahydrofolate reductase [NAD(P)H] [Proteobacteria bacterium]|nr:methylenetetrahydrofolate reductase [NAD(P)H] [Pseudomonadota bacterium]